MTNEELQQSYESFKNAVSVLDYDEGVVIGNYVGKLHKRVQELEKENKSLHDRLSKNGNKHAGQLKMKENQNRTLRFDNAGLSNDLFQESKENEGLRAWNKRYKQALEFYADQRNWNEPSQQEVLMDGEPDIVEGPPPAIEIGGLKAIKALRGDNDDE